MLDNQRDPQDMSSMLYVKKDRIYDKSDAVIEILRKLDFKFIAFFANLIPKFIRDTAYGFIATHRYRLMGV